MSDKIVVVDNDIAKPKASDPAVAEARVMAQKANDLRKKAPMTSVGAEFRISQKMHMRRMADEYKTKGLEAPHMLFIQKKTMKDYAYQGYAPILEQIDGGDSIEIEGDIMVGCSEAQYQEYLQINSKRSKRKTSSAMKKMAEDSSGVAGETSIRTATRDSSGNVTERDLLGSSD